MFSVLFVALFPLKEVIVLLLEFLFSPIDLNLFLPGIKTEFDFNFDFNKYA